MTSPGKLVGGNVSRLRSERGWSQLDLANALVKIDPGWSRAAVGMLEAQGTRGDRLSDVLVLCAALECSLVDLLTGDEVVKLRSGEEVEASSLRGAINQHRPTRRGPDRLKPAHFVGIDNPDDARQLARRLEVSIGDLRKASESLGGDSSPSLWRDKLAGITSTTARETARARRGLVTRQIEEWIRRWNAGEREELIDEIRAYRPPWNEAHHGHR